MSPRVDAAPARAAVRYWMRRGWSALAIARASGMSGRAVADVARGAHPRIEVCTADALLGVTAGLLETHSASVPATATMRRLQHLQLNGYSQKRIAAEIGTTQQLISYISRGTHMTVRKDLCVRVRDYFESRWLIPGGDPRAHMTAVARGWVSIAAWDDIDNPRERAKGADAA